MMVTFNIIFLDNFNTLEFESVLMRAKPTSYTIAEKKFFGTLFLKPKGELTEEEKEQLERIKKPNLYRWAGQLDSFKDVANKGKKRTLHKGKLFILIVGRKSNFHDIEESIIELIEELRQSLIPISIDLALTLVSSKFAQFSTLSRNAQRCFFRRLSKRKRLCIRRITSRTLPSMIVEIEKTKRDFVEAIELKIQDLVFEYGIFVEDIIIINA